VTMMVISVFQATGAKVQPMLLSLIRKGGFDIPLMFVINRFWGVYGIPFATPTSDVMAMITALCLFVPYLRRLRREETELALTGKNK